MTSGRAARVAALAAVALAIAATAWLLFAPCAIRSVSNSQTTSPDGQSTMTRSETCQTLLESQGRGLLVALAIPIALTLLGSAGVFTWIRSLAWVSAGLLMLLAIGTGFSIGMFYMPSAGALLTAAALVTAARRDRISAVDPER